MVHVAHEELGLQSTQILMPRLTTVCHMVRACARLAC